VLYTARSLYYNNHYGRLITNTSSDEDKLVFTIKFYDLKNLVVQDGFKKNQIRGKVGPNESLFMMLAPIVPHGKVACKLRTQIDFATDTSARSRPVSRRSEISFGSPLNEP
jgi:hypothetical protein